MSEKPLTPSELPTAEAWVTSWTERLGATAPEAVPSVLRAMTRNLQALLDAHRMGQGSVAAADAAAWFEEHAEYNSFSDYAGQMRAFALRLRTEQQPKSASCAHDKEAFVLDVAADMVWCCMCGALRLEGKWTLPDRLDTESWRGVLPRVEPPTEQEKTTPADSGATGRTESRTGTEPAGRPGEAGESAVLPPSDAHPDLENGECTVDHDATGTPCPKEARPRTANPSTAAPRDEHLTRARAWFQQHVGHAWMWADVRALATMLDEAFDLGVERQRMADVSFTREQIERELAIRERKILGCRFENGYDEGDVRDELLEELGQVRYAFGIGKRTPHVSLEEKK